MTGEFDIMASATNSIKDATDLLGGLFRVAQPEAVFGKPVTQGEYTVITANELSVGMGVGFGSGSGIDNSGAQSDQATTESPASSGELSGGGGGGGGGASSARPVAVISVGPNGVHVEPVVDVTKIAITLFTLVGAFLLALAKRPRRS